MAPDNDLKMKIAILVEAQEKWEESVVVESEPITINLNDRCTVVLTKEGANILTRQSLEFVEKYGMGACKQYHEGDEYSCVLWKLIQDFGYYMDAGVTPVIEGNDITITRETYAGVQDNGNICV